MNDRAAYVWTDCTADSELGSEYAGGLSAHVSPNDQCPFTIAQGVVEQPSEAATALNFGLHPCLQSTPPPRAARRKKSCRCAP